MTKNELKTLIRGALIKDANSTVNFADAQEAARTALLEYYGVTEETSYRELKKIKDFTVVEEILDEIVPKQVEDIMGAFAKVLTFGRNEEVVYEVKNLGKRRALLSIVPGARAGIYKARRLDGKILSFGTHVLTAGVFVQLEDILLGKATLGELLSNIMDGVQYQIYKDIVSALRTIKTQAPQANRTSQNGLVKSEMDKLVRIVNAYGENPVIVCFHSFATQINNMVPFAGATPNFPGADIEEIRAKGVVSTYYGTPVIEVPNYLLDENNEDWMFSEADAFVLGSDVKPVIVAFQGEGYIQENAHALGGAEQNYHRMMGTAILTYNNLCIYTDLTIATTEAGKELI